ncbi:hypothetical protein BASA81_008884 [Batrachochytrium salamandrivorans]|nr:hypothetical protein BASA81_008884 [Batrachochytrium salamandrivorans]
MFTARRAFATVGGSMLGFAVGATTIAFCEEQQQPSLLKSHVSGSLPPRTGTQAPVTPALLKPALLFPLDVDEDDFDSVIKDEETTGSVSKNLYIPASEHSAFTIFSGNANERLANEVAMLLGMQLGRVKMDRFTDGEVNIQVLDNVRGKDCFVIQSLSNPVNESVMDLLLMTSCLRRASAKQITAVIPYFPYTRARTQTSSDKPFVAAADLAKMLTVAGVDRVVLVDVHSKQVQGFFGLTPADDLDVSGVAAEYFNYKKLRNPVIVSPDHDGVQRATRFRDLLLQNGTYDDVHLAIVVDQRRDKTQTAFNLQDFDLVGEVTGRDCIIRDDIGETGQRIVQAAQKLKEQGANRVFAYITHPLFTSKAIDLLEEEHGLEEVVCLNTVPLRKVSSKIRQLSVGWLLAESVRRIHENKSLSVLFADKIQYPPVVK